MYDLVMVMLFGMVVFWLWMVVDWFHYERTDRTIWLCLIISLNVVGAFAYLCLKYRGNREENAFPQVSSQSSPAEMNQLELTENCEVLAED